MPIYTCERCDKTYTNKFDFGRHLKRKIPCALKKSPNSTTKTTKSDTCPDVTKEFTCIYCNKDFTTNFALTRHAETRCKVKTNMDNESIQLIASMAQKIEQLETENKTLKETKNNSTNIVSNTDSNNTVNNNYIKKVEVKLLAYGKEDLSYITDNNYIKLFDRGFCSVNDFIKLIHFDKDKPQNHNLYLSRLRGDFAVTYDGNDWAIGKVDEIIEELYKDKRDFLEEKFEELIKKVPPRAIKKFKNFLNEQKDDKISAQLKKDITMTLYNCQKIPKETRRILESNA
jgi:hypothetical protein